MNILFISTEGCFDSIKTEDFTAMVDRMLKSDKDAMGSRGYAFLKENYIVEQTYNTIINHIYVKALL